MGPLKKRFHTQQTTWQGGKGVCELMKRNALMSTISDCFGLKGLFISGEFIDRLETMSVAQAAHICLNPTKYKRVIIELGPYPGVIVFLFFF